MSTTQNIAGDTVAGIKPGNSLCGRKLIDMCRVPLPAASLQQRTASR
ncbi:MAG: hypothetical protein R3C19_04640 [Planctomycetaceae bacterium]